MNARQQIILICIFVFSLLISGCGPGQLFGPAFISISAGDSHTCALTEDGRVQCWGSNEAGQLGNGSFTNSMKPVTVSGLSAVVSAIAAGGLHTCALTSNGGVKCWGSNGYGQLGDGTINYHTTPVNVIGLESGVSAIAAGSAHTCALMTGGGVKCWGINSYGQLGDSKVTTTAPYGKTAPVDVSGLTSGVSAIAAGQGQTCALMETGGVKCWGYNEHGQLGDGAAMTTAPYAKPAPVDVSGLTTGVSAIASGSGQTCALLSGGGVKCWGSNAYGELGDGTTNNRAAPVDVIGLTSGVSAIAAGYQHTCALTVNGGVKCWGAGQWGDDTSHYNTYSVMPVDVKELISAVAAIAAGHGHTCVLISGGGVKCWGTNVFGQLGDGTTTDQRLPVDVKH